ncbi:MAG: hypothetical protein AAFY80_13490 [Pseudomonadota bacterium]
MPSTRFRYSKGTQIVTVIVPDGIVGKAGLPTHRGGSDRISLPEKMGWKTIIRR